MAVRINSIPQTAVANDLGSTPQVKRAATPAGVSSLSTYTQAPTKVTFDDGRSIAVPDFTDEQRQQMAAVFGNVSPQQLQQLTTAGSSFAQAAIAASPGGDISNASTILRRDSQNFATATVTSGALAPSAHIATSKLTTSLGNAASVYQNVTGNTDTVLTAQAATYMGLLGLQSDLTAYAKKVKGNLDRKQQTQTELADVSQEITDWPAGQDTQTFKWTTYDENGKALTHTEKLTQAQARDVAKQLEGQINTFTDQNQMDQIHLERMMQNMQQGYNTVSNLSKANFDTIKAILNNVRVG